MPRGPSVLRLSAIAPETARRFGVIMAGLAALVARRFLREPHLIGLVGPLWSWLNRCVQRFEQARPQTTPRKAPTRTASARVATVTPKLRLPSGKAWLVRALGWEAAGYGSQLETLLGEPEMQTLLASMPTLGRILRPVCRMLGVTTLNIMPKTIKPRAATRPRRVPPRAEIGTPHRLAGRYDRVPRSAKNSA